MTEPDRIWRTTPLLRSLVDLQTMIEDGPHSAFFRSPDTIRAMHEEQKRLTKTLNVVYLITGVLAFLILLGTPSKDAKISAFGIEAPLNLLPQQVLAVFMAGIFGFYATQFMSFLLLHQTVGKVLALERKDSWQFLSAPFDASTLWAVIMGPKTIGYTSPKRVLVLSLLIFVVAAGTVLLHAFVVAAAAAISAWRAWETGGWLSITLGSGAIVIVGASILSFFAAVIWPMPYRWPEGVPFPVDGRPPDGFSPGLAKTTSPDGE